MGKPALKWLLRAQGPDGGWGGEAGVTPSLEETALAVDALASWGLADSAALDAGLRWLNARIEAADYGASPIGLYFAKLWYYEREYPLVFTLAALEKAAKL